MYRQKNDRYRDSSTHGGEQPRWKTHPGFGLIQVFIEESLSIAIGSPSFDYANGRPANFVN